MKASIISLCVFLILVILIVINVFYINRVTSDFISRVEELSPSDLLVCEKIYNDWTRNHFYICLSVSHEKTDKIEESFLVLLEKLRGGDEEGFYENKVLLINYIEEIKRLQTLTLDTVL